MTPTPTGWIDCSAEIPVLVFERALPVPIEAAWTVLTKSQLTARWIGSWSGEAEPGKTIEVVWLAEEGTPAELVRILWCEAPKRLALATGPDKDRPWLITIDLHETETGTTLEFRQQMSNGLSPAMVGTGWEFYLDRYAGALAGNAELPSWDDHYQQLQPHYEELQAAMALCTDE